jgi:hypothetical protein
VNEALFYSLIDRLKLFEQQQQQQQQHPVKIISLRTAEIQCHNKSIFGATI